MPIHHIDASILLEDASLDSGKECQRYLARAGNIFSGKLSLTALGEVFYSIVRLDDETQRYDLFNAISETIRTRGIELYSCFPRELPINKRFSLDHADKCILSAAIQGGAERLVTLDGKLLKLKSAGKVKISHPTEFLRTSST